MMALDSMLALSMMLASPTASTRVFADPVDDAQLGKAVGTGSPTTRFSVLVGEQGSAQSQWLGEDQRAALATWFADNNIQNLANLTIRER